MTLLVPHDLQDAHVADACRFADGAEAATIGDSLRFVK